MTLSSESDVHYDPYDFGIDYQNERYDFFALRLGVIAVHTP